MRGMIQGVRAVVALECEGFDRLFSWGRWIVPVAALCTGLVFGWFRPGITFMYSESVLFLMLSLAAGTLGRTTAAAFVGGFVLGDGAWYVISGAFALSARSKQGGQFDMGLGRITAWIALWFFASSIPFLARTAAVAVIASRPRFRGIRGSTARLLVAVIGAPVIAATAYAALQLMAYIIPPAFALRSPSVAAIIPLQRGAPLIALVAACIFMVAELVLRPRLGRLADLIGVLPIFDEGTGAAFVSRLSAFVLAMVLLRGIITGLPDVAILGAAFLVGEAGSRALRHATVVSRWIAWIPWAVRTLAAAAIAALTFQSIYDATYGQGPPTPYFPLVMAASAGYLAFRLLLPDQGEVRGRKVPEPGPHPAVGAQVPLWLAVTGALMVGSLVAPPALRADNCGDPADCINGAFAAAWAAAAAAAGFLWGMAKSMAPFPRVIGVLEPAASEQGAEAEGGGIDALKRLAATRKDANEGTDENPTPGDAIRNMSRGEFAQARARGDFANLGIGGE